MKCCQPGNSCLLQVSVEIPVLCQYLGLSRLFFSNCGNKLNSIYHLVSQKAPRHQTENRPWEDVELPLRFVWCTDPLLCLSFLEMMTQNASTQMWSSAVGLNAWD